MGRKKLLQKLAEFFDMDSHARNKRKAELNELLKRLKEKEVSLKQEMEQQTDQKARDKLAQKIEVVHTQRKKGLAILKELRSQSD